MKLLLDEPYSDLAISLWDGADVVTWDGRLREAASAEGFATAPS